MRWNALSQVSLESSSEWKHLRKQNKILPKARGLTANHVAHAVPGLVDAQTGSWSMTWKRMFCPGKKTCQLTVWHKISHWSECEKYLLELINRSPTPRSPTALLHGPGDRLSTMRVSIRGTLLSPVGPVLPTSHPLSLLGSARKLVTCPEESDVGYVSLQ